LDGLLIVGFPGYFSLDDDGRANGAAAGNFVERSLQASRKRLQGGKGVPIWVNLRLVALGFLANCQFM
jgi:hypothetical protein